MYSLETLGSGKDSNLFIYFLRLGFAFKFDVGFIEPKETL